jgi:hypothetical protein
MAKVEKESGGKWGELGGNNKMHSWSGTGTQEAGQSAQEGTGSKRGIEPKAGGNKAFVSSGAHNTHGAGPQEAGQSASAGSKQEGFAHGGKGHMFGNRGSRKMPEGQSGPNG